MPQLPDGGNSAPLHKVLVANRGEIAVRVIRACRDASLASVAVYADPDRDAPFVRLADEAFALGGNTPGESYLSIDKILDAAKRAGADAVHPGYGFLSENADFAQAVIDAGLNWVGPSPQAIRDLGDKVTARHIATRAGAPLVPGTSEPVNGPEEILAFAEEHGLPIAIKAAFGGGGRGLKVARTKEEIPELFESAVREAVAAFGRGECFVERYLDKPRHVEAQVLADKHGNVIVVGTRDCSLQRRHQKLVEEAPAPYLTDAQRAQIHSSAKAICARGRLPRRRHRRVPGRRWTAPSPSWRSTPGCRSSTRSARKRPGWTWCASSSASRPGKSCASPRIPTPRGHSIEFRINGEDAGRGFLPAPGTVSTFIAPDGPGVRTDSGVESGSVVGGAFDSLLAKLIVTGEDRQQALERVAARAGRDGR